MKVLNLYAGIGGNRKLWEDVEVTAVELDPDIAKIYQDYFPDDTVIVGDAHSYLLEHYKEFDFIWASPPCQSHSKIRNEAAVGSGQNEAIYPDMKLYQEIILLDKHLKGTYCVENVEPYYEPLIPGKKIGRHLFWTNFNIGGFETNNKKKGHLQSGKNYLQEFLGFNIDDYKGEKTKLQLLRNCVNPHEGLYILNCARNIITKQNEKQIDLFE